MLNMLKIKYYVLPILAVFILSSCEKNSLGTDVLQTYYEGILVQEGPAPFLINTSAGTVLHKGQKEMATIPEPPLNGTVYGNEEFPEKAYKAFGGEKLPAGSWVANNIKGRTFRLILNKDGIANFKKVVSVKIISASDELYYDDGSGVWVKVSSPGYISALSLWATDGPDDKEVKEDDGSADLGKISKVAVPPAGEFETCCVTNIGGGSINN